MKSEEKIDQKKLLRLIKLLNETFKTKIKTKGSITDLAEAFATGIEALTNRNASIPDEAADFYNDLFQDEAQGYREVDTDKGKTEPEPPPEESETVPLDEIEQPAGDSTEELEELPELEPEQELPGEDDVPPPESPPTDELEELDNEPPAPTTKPRTPKQTPKAAPQKEEPNMLEALNTITKKPEVKAFVKEHNLNVKLKNSESLQVWKAKIKKLIEGICKTPEPAAENPGKATKKAPAKPKAAAKAPAKPKPKAEGKKPVKKAGKPRGDKDPFGIVIGSLTHKFVQAIYKKPHTMRQLIDANIGKHPKTLKKLVAMGYMERDKAGIISMTAKGRNVYGKAAGK